MVREFNIRQVLERDISLIGEICTPHIVHRELYHSVVVRNAINLEAYISR